MRALPPHQTARTRASMLLLLVLAGCGKDGSNVNDTAELVRNEPITASNKDSGAFWSGRDQTFRNWQGGREGPAELPTCAGYVGNHAITFLEPDGSALYQFSTDHKGDIRRPHEGRELKVSLNCVTAFGSRHTTGLETVVPGSRLLQSEASQPLDVTRGLERGLLYVTGRLGGRSHLEVLDAAGQLLVDHEQGSIHQIAIRETARDTIVLAHLTRKDGDMLEVLRGDPTKADFLETGRRLMTTPGRGPASLLLLAIDPTGTRGAVLRRLGAGSPNQDDTYEILVFDLSSGDEVMRLQPAQFADWAFAPDGASLAVATKQSEDSGRVTVYSSSSAKPPHFTVADVPIRVLWRPDGQLLVFSRDRYFRWKNGK